MTPDYVRRRMLEAARRANPSMSAAQRRRMVDEAIAFAEAEGRRIRAEHHARQVNNLRAELADRARRGAYPRRRWAKLRRLEAQA